MPRDTADLLGDLRAAQREIRDRRAQLRKDDRAVRDAIRALDPRARGGRKPKAQAPTPNGRPRQRA